MKMMAIDQSQIDRAITSAPSEAHCRAIDKVLAERRRIERLRSAAAIRTDEESPWLVLKVSGSEVSIRDAMVEAGIEVIVPMKKGTEIRRRGFVIPPKMRPLLVGYMLVRCLQTNDAMAGILSFDGVVSMLGDFEKPYHMSADKVRDFNRKAEEGEFDDERPISLFSHLQKVRVVEGPFAGRIGEVVTSVGAGKGTAVIELELFGRPVPMIMSLAFLAPL